MPWASERRTVVVPVSLTLVFVLGLALVSTLLVSAPDAQASTLRDQQWGLAKIRAPEAWPATRGAGTIVAVIDTGVDLTHPDLAPQLLRDREGRVVGRDFVDGGAPQDEQGHGTLVAGIVAATGRDAGAVAGVAPRTRIMPLRALDENGAGSSRDIDAAIRWAVDRGADVVNLSLESAVPVPGQVVSTGFDQAVHYAWERGVVVVAAAGNSPTGTPFTDYAPSTPVLLVGATDREDRRAFFSDGGHSEGGRSDLVVAPGVDVLTTACDPCGQNSRAGHATASGTSFAAPHVAGAVALLLSEGRSPQQAVDALRRTAVPVRGSGLGSSGHGRIDVAAAMGLGRPSASGPSRDDASSTSRPRGAADGGGQRTASEPVTSRPRGRPAQPSTPSPASAPSQAATEGTQDPADAVAQAAPEPVPLEPADPAQPADPEQPAEADEHDPAAEEEVLVPTGAGLRFGMVHAIATLLVGMTAFTVGSVIRKLGGLDEVAT